LYFFLLDINIDDLEMRDATFVYGAGSSTLPTPKKIIFK